MWPKSLKNGSFQVSLLILFYFISSDPSVFGFCIKVCADSTDSVNQPLDTVCDTAMKNSMDVDIFNTTGTSIDTAANDSGESGQLPPNNMQMDGKNGGDNETLQTDKRNRSTAVHRRAWMITMSRVIQEIFGIKWETPLKVIDWIKIHLKKILFLSGSFVLILFTLSFYQQRRERGGEQWPHLDRGRQPARQGQRAAPAGHARQSGAHSPGRRAAAGKRRARGRRQRGHDAPLA